MGLDMYLYVRREINDEATRRAIADATAGVERWDDDPSLYLSRWSHAPADEKAVTDQVIELAGLTHMIGEESNSASCAHDGSWVQLTAVYWRKANAVHGWFVENCQDGVDECQEAEVHVEQLAALASACEAALAAYRSGDLAGVEKAMPPRPGFFFGSTDLDEWWVADLKYTITEIHRVVNAAIATRGVSFVYQSSW